VKVCEPTCSSTQPRSAHTSPPHAVDVLRLRVGLEHHREDAPLDQQETRAQRRDLPQIALPLAAGELVDDVESGDPLDGAAAAADVLVVQQQAEHVARREVDVGVDEHQVRGPRLRHHLGDEIVAGPGDQALVRHGQERPCDSLLAGLEDPANETVWRGYVERFRPMLVRWFRRVGLAAADADDVAQDVLLAFANAYRDGKYDRERGRLRAWLFGIARTMLRGFHRRRQRREVQLVESDAGGGSMLDHIAADGEIEAAWEQEWRDAVLRRRRTRRSSCSRAAGSRPATEPGEHLQGARHQPHEYLRDVLVRLAVETDITRLTPLGWQHDQAAAQRVQVNRLAIAKVVREFVREHQA
jgi:RNA polymerase sigma factor (sigma-70 family)